MQKWEYLIVYVEQKNVEKIGIKKIVTMINREFQGEDVSDGMLSATKTWKGKAVGIIDLMETLGEIGWELVSVKGTTYDTCGVYYFKRSKE